MAKRTVTLREWDWDLQNYVERHYPLDMVEEFINWLRDTNAWHGDVQLVHDKLNRLNARFMEYRERPPDGRQRKLEALQRGRATQAKKREGLAAPA